MVGVGGGCLTIGLAVRALVRKQLRSRMHCITYADDRVLLVMIVTTWVTSGMVCLWVASKTHARA
jgi:hypothetical protein